MDYPLENLGPERFQHLCQALLSREYPHVQCFPVAQPDGGRDAVAYFEEGNEGKFMVFQVKYARKPLAEEDPHGWLVGIIDQELPKLQQLIPRGAARYVLATNIPGTAHLDTGSIDRLNELLSNRLGVPSVCWWRDDLNRRLDNAWSLKWVYSELMTGPDFFRAIIESGLSEHRERRSSAIRAFVRAQYDMDEEVRFKQVELQNKLLNLFIDVPVTFRDSHAEAKQLYFFQHVIASTVQRRAGDSDEPEYDPAHGYVVHEDDIGAASLLLSPAMQLHMPRVVIEGAPGQGKSTIAQYICQIHRMKLLAEFDALNSVDQEHKSASARLPIKVDLRDFATWIAKKDPFASDDFGNIPPLWHRSLEAFLAALISHQSGGTQFNTDDLLAVMRISSVLLVFDGLDEIADMNGRKDIVDEIVKGVQRLEENAASLQVVVTSRPAAFANSPGMPHAKYPHLQLLSLTRQLILTYAERWLRARHLPVREGSDFRRVLRDKLDQPHLRDLARNPMQLAILLSLLLTRGASLPDKRTALYDFYIDLFFSREAEKSLIVRNHRELLIDIHRYLAWLLQSEAEQGNAQASIAQDRLHQVVTDYLQREGHNPALAKDLFAGMVERVVALVSRVEGTFEFEVQPLREYFAACHLYYTAPQSSPGKEKPGSKPDRFDAIAHNFYWLNVTRFYAGCYSKGELPSLVERLQELTAEDALRNIAYPRLLAATLLSDWVFTQNPKSVQQVVELIVKDSGLRFLLASSRRGPGIRSRSGVPTELTLPSKCGRDELFSHCFGLLRTRVQRDYSAQILDVLRANSASAPDLTAEWLRHYNLESSEKSLVWLEYGLRLGVLQTVPLEDLRRLVPSCVTDANLLSLLFRARRFDYLQASEQQFDETINGILERQLMFPSRERIESVLEALSRSVDGPRYSTCFHSRQPVPLASILSRRERTVPSQTPIGPFATGRYENHAKCIELAAVADEELNLTSQQWVSDLGPWDRIVETGRSLWGDRYAFCYLATIASAIRSTSERCSDCPDLLDHSRSLTRRVRHARLRGAAQNWWKTQFRSARSTVEKELVLLVALSWGNLNVVTSNLEELEPLVAELDQSRWRRLVYDARRVGMNAGFRIPKAKMDFDVELLPKDLSPRIAALLGNKIQATDRVCRKYLRSYDGDDPIVLELLAEEALDSKHFGKPSWNPDVERLQRCYEQGIAFEPYNFALEHVRREDPTSVPVNVAKKIAEAPSSFPEFLLAYAEERCRQEVAATVIPVAAVADKEKWFLL